MNHSDTRTSAASNNSQNPAPTPSTAKADPAEAQPAKTPKSVKAESTRTEQAKSPKVAGPVTASRTSQTGAQENTASTPPGPTDLISEAKAAAPAKTGEATEQIPKRIVHPAPHQSGPGPDTVEEVLKSPEGKAPKESGLHHQADKKSSTDQDVPGVPANAVAGGFKGLNNWLDSLPEPNLERLGDRIYAAPATFKKRWQRMRVERAKAAELREQERLVEVARAEAKAEASKRENARVAHQAKLDSATRQADEARLQASIPRPVESPDPVESPAQPKPELHVGNLVPGPAHDWETVEHESADHDVKISPSGTAVASTPAPQVDPDELAALVASAKAAIDQQQAAVEEPVYEAPYVLPETGPNPAAEPADLRRRILGGGAAVAAAIVALANLETLSSGRVESLGSNYSLLSLAPSAHLIWPVVFVWAVLGAVYSWAPSQRSAVRQRAVGNRFALACAGNALWMLSALNNWLFPAFGFAAASCWFLYTAVRELNLHTARNQRERMLTDAPVSLMTGFSLVMLASTLTNMLQSWGAGGAGLWFATILVPALGYGAATLAMTERGRIILALGFGWGMFWLLVPRVLGTNDSIWVAILAGMAGFVVLLATENRRYQIHHAEHRAARGKPTDFS